jgi:hypothetical protein
MKRQFQHTCCGTLVALLTAVGCIPARTLMMSMLTVLAPALLFASTPNDHPPVHHPSMSAIITNGTIMLGVNDEGHLNILPDPPMPSSGGTEALGLRFLPTGADGTSPGCLCEGWGVGDSGRGVSGRASRDLGGVSNVALESFNATEATAISVVTVGGVFRITHDFHPSPATPFLYEVTVTIENISGQDLTDVRYRRLMDWDIEPTAFEEFVTINSGTAENLAFVTNNGFDSPDPLLPPALGDFTLGDRVDDGPKDHGALFQFEFGALAAGERLLFNIYYGAAPTELDALIALSAVGAEAFSLGQPSGTDGPDLGKPNTFIFGFTGIGGVSIVGEIALDPPIGTNDLGTNHTVIATVTEGGDPVVGTAVKFKVAAGPNKGETATTTTDSNGKATFTYPGDRGEGCDEITAAFVAPTTGVTINARPVIKRWRTTVGDVNGDGGRNTRDADELLQRLVHDEAISLIADLDGDGIITNRDSILLLGIEAGLIPPPPDPRRFETIVETDGTIRLTGKPGAAPSDRTEVRLTNTRSGEVISAPIAPDGSFGPITVTTPPLLPGDRLTLDIDGGPAKLSAVFPVPFVQPNDFPVGKNPAAIAVGDFNGDGKPDLAVANEASNTVSLLLGGGTNLFLPGGEVSVGTRPAALAVGDFNGDGKPDLAVANEASNTVSLLLGEGADPLQPAVEVPVGNTPAALAVGDFNGDGKPDLAVANEASNTVSLLLSGGTNLFLPGGEVSVGTRPAALAVGDFNGDGKPDLAVANEASNTVSLLLNNGNGTFEPMPSIGVGLDPEAVVTGDFNGDGKPDLAVANAGSNDVSVLLGNSNGLFQPARHHAADCLPIALGIGDLNNDGFLDLVVVNEGSRSISQLLGDGAGNFAAGIFQHVVKHTPSGIAVEDFDDNGTLDLAVPNTNDESIVSVLLNALPSMPLNGQ